MELQYIANWEKIKQNFRAWWEHEYFGRCAVSITAPKNNVNFKLPPVPSKIEDRWLDFNYLTAKNESRIQSTFYCGEAFPLWDPGFPGYSRHCVFLGCNIILKEATGWIYPNIENGDLTSYDFRNFIIDKKNKWYEFSLNVQRFIANQSKDKCISKNLNCGSSGDTLAAMRTTEKLLFDLIDCPEYVRDFELFLMEQWKDIYDSFYEITNEAAVGSECLWSLWSPGKSYAVQNDFAYMISAKMFENIFLPAIEMQINYLDHSVYHVDGIGNFKHVDALLGLKKLKALQILPGAGQPSPLHYTDILKKIQASGRNLHISIPACEVKQALDQLSARRLFIVTKCETEQDAQDLLQCVEKWSVDRG